MIAAGVLAAASANASPPGRRVEIFAPAGGPNTTWWVNPVYPAELRQRPSKRAKPVARLHLSTEDGFPEVDLIATEARTSTGQTWLRIEQPARPTANVGWAPASVFTPPTADHTRLIVNRERLHAVLYRNGRAIWHAPIGVGKPSTPTPAGHFWVREKFIVSGDGLYGNRAIGTSAYSPYLTDWPNGAVIGIHGTDQPSLIPGRPSHGCIRIQNADIDRLYPLIPIGTPIIIS